MDKRILDVLVCPVCKSSLDYVEADQELICKADRLAFPVRDGMPIMLQDEAREIPATDEL
ncbi:MAG TPA: Trm112 family protein [Paenalcaligenes sp.]|nr:Trm112 family protein [Paenalcaligenes sp.]